MKGNIGTKLLVVILVILIIVAGVILGYKIVKDKENNQEATSIRRK